MFPRSILPPSYEQVHGQARRIELASDRTLRERNKLYYRFNHWPIWIFVFFIAPGPMTFHLFEHGFTREDGAVAGGWSCWAPVFAGSVRPAARREPAPYIIRFTEDRPNPIYRRICYTVAWGEAGCRSPS